MNISEQVDIIAKKSEIVKVKSLGFIAMAGGSFVYALKEDTSMILNLGIWLVFALSVYGIIVNLQKFSSLYRQLERIEDDTV